MLTYHPNPLAELSKRCHQARCAKYADIPPSRIPVKKYTDRTANALTQAVIRHLQLLGYFATRLDSKGTYRADLGLYVHSQQRSGMPDVYAIVHGIAVHIEIKAGRDKLSRKQNETIADIKASGGKVIVARTFADFVDDFKVLETLIVEDWPLLGPAYNLKPEKK